MYPTDFAVHNTLNDEFRFIFKGDKKIDFFHFNLKIKNIDSKSQNSQTEKNTVEKHGKILL